jgi:ferritin
MLKWFVDEQVEEEATADEILQKLKRVKGSMGSLLMFDHKLGKRGKE